MRAACDSKHAGNIHTPFCDFFPQSARGSTVLLVAPRAVRASPKKTELCLQPVARAVRNHLCQKKYER